MRKIGNKDLQLSPQETQFENGCGKSDFFWSEIGSGFEERGGTLPLRSPGVPPGRIPQAKISRIPESLTWGEV